MTTYAGSIDMTEAGIGVKFSAVVGSSGVTAGYPVVWDGSHANTVIASTTSGDVVVGIARDTVSSGGTVTVLGPGCAVLTPFTLTVGGKVGCGVTGTAGQLVNWTAGTVVGTVDTSGALASIVRVSIQY